MPTPRGALCPRITALNAKPSAASVVQQETLRRSFVSCLFFPDPPMNLSDIKELLRAIAESGIEEVEVEQDGTRVVVRRSGATVSFASPMPAMSYAPPPYMPYPPQMPYGPPPVAYAPSPTAPAPMAHDGTGIATPPAPVAAAAPEAPAAPTGVTLRAPIVGTFYASGSPDAPPFVAVGDTVAKGQVLCIIEAMKLMNEIEAEVAGTVRQVLAQNAQPVEYDQPLFLIEPA